MGKLVASRKEVSREYLGLIRRFPLRPIRSDRELKTASRLVDELLDRKLKKDEEAYLDVLGTLIEQYEEANHPIEEVTAREMLEHLIEARGVSKRRVALEIDIAVSTISELVSGKRLINLTHIQKLARYFGVEPECLSDRVKPALSLKFVRGDGRQFKHEGAVHPCC